MNHHYSDNYHGYVRGSSGMHNMGYGHGMYNEQMAMGQMAHSQNYPMPQYQDGGQVHPMMQHQQHQNSMYPSGGGYMNQMPNSYGMGTYANYGMTNSTGMSAASPSMMMGPRGTNMMGAYYNNQVDSHNNPHMTGGGGGNPNYSQIPPGANAIHSQGPMNPMVVNQACSPSQTATAAGTMQGGHGQPHTVSPHGMPPAHSTAVSMPGQANTAAHAMMPGVQGQQPQQQQRPMAGNMPSVGSGMHPIPQHPMRQPAVQQNPQEVADNILQIASSYPTNQTVQVPLKSRHAPYHIPRSPHYSMSSSDPSHSSPMPSHSQQASPAPQPSPTHSSPSVKSPTPSLAPIPNPIPSPGVTGLRSPGTGTYGAQHSPAHMPSNFSGHSQPSQSPHHYPPSNMGNQQIFSHYAHSPTVTSNSHTLPYPQTQHDPGIYSMNTSDHKTAYNTSQSPLTNHSQTRSSMPPVCSSAYSLSSSSAPQYNMQGRANDPLMSLQKLVMLPETQVVDPKSVVNDACLSSQSNENEEIPKNGDGPAEGFEESPDSSVGCSDNISSRGAPQSTEEIPPANQIETDVQSDSTSSVQAKMMSSVDEDENVSGTQRNDQVGNSMSASSMNENVFNDSMSTKVESGLLTPPQSNPSLDNVTLVDDISESTTADNKSAFESLSTEGKDDVSVMTPAEIEKSVTSESSNTIEEVALIPEVKEPLVLNGISDTNFQSETDSLKSEDSGVDVRTEDVKRSLRRRKEKVNCLNGDMKQSLPYLSPSGILAEVPVLPNGYSSPAHLGSVDDQDGSEDVDSGRPKNGFSTRLRSKLRIGEKLGRFNRITTPCSIAVGADERAVCERFSFRPNEYCHTLRTSSQLLCNGRARQDSTGNGDSDESVENVSYGGFHVFGNPQDGSKKKAPSTSTKRPESRKPVNSNSKSARDNGVASQRNAQTHNGHVSTSTSNTHNSAISDEEGDVCYYEGVDSSDFFMSMASSDESIPSSQEGKQTSPDHSTSKGTNRLCSASGSTAHDTPHEPLNKEFEDDNVSSPPAKRTRRSAEQITPDSLNKKNPSHLHQKEKLVNNNNSSEKFDASEHDDMSTISSSGDHEGKGQVTHSRNRRNLVPPDPPESKHASDLGLGEPQIKVEPSSTPCDKMTPIPIIIDSSPEKCEEEALCKYSSSSLSHSTNALEMKQEPSVSSSNELNAGAVAVVKSEHAEASGAGALFVDVKHSIKSKSNKRRKVVKKSKKKNTVQGSRDRTSEIKDSFKSMKFSRTLDMMKIQKKKDALFTGPFIRIDGDKNAPNSVAVFNQSSYDLLPSGSKPRSNQKQSQVRSTSTALHMVSSLSSDKAVMVSSSKFIPSPLWSCAFCSHHSSFQSLGDLFGPYFREEDLPLVDSIASEESKKEASSTPSKSSKTSPADKKGVRKRTSAKSGENLPQEIWLHESCALWAPGVFLLGNRIYGLDDAIRDTAETMCSECKRKGAMVGCLYKGCSLKYHFACAIENDCHFDEENFSLLCPKHKDKKLAMVSFPPAASTSAHTSS